MGIATGLGYLCYVASFRAVGTPSISFHYALKLGFNPWFITAVFLSGATIFVRPFLYEAVGATKGYWVLVGVSGVMSALIVMFSLKESLSMTQWLGVALAFTGAVLVSR
jgi:drug/metabolite transporter (DMT)-like permease